MGAFGLYHELRDFGRSVVGCICCFIVVGPILLIVGIAMLVAAGTDTRSSSISSYNSAVSLWTAGGANSSYTLLSSLANTGAISVVVDAQATYGLTTSSSYDFPRVETGGDINGYSSFAVASTTEGNGVPMSQLGWSNTRTASLSFTVAPPGGAAPASLLINNVPVTSSTQQSWTVDTCSSSKQSQLCPFGSWTCGFVSGTRIATCSQWWSLSQVCVVYDPVARTFSPSSGCTVPGRASSSPSNYAAIVPSAGRPVNGLSQFAYTAYTSQPIGGAYPASGGGTTGLTLLVRAAQDPWLVAMKLTGASGGFGLTTGQKVGVGIALLAVGAVATVLPCMVIFMLFKCCEHRRISRRGGTINTTTVVAMPMPVAGGGGAYNGLPSPVVVPVLTPQHSVYPPQQAYPVPAQPQAYAPQPPAGYAPQGYAPQGYAPAQPNPYYPQQPPQQYAPQPPASYAPPGGYAPQGYTQQQQQPQYPPQGGYAYPTV